MKMLFILVTMLVSESLGAYQPHKAMEYAHKWWNGANHKCSGSYLSCTPWSYFGGERCGYPTHGGDCANFVSQCLIEAGHPHMNQGGPCAGYPCGKEVVGATALAQCLQQKHGWHRHCGAHHAPPDGMKIGDVLVFHKGSCTAFDSHATLIVHVKGGIRVAAHSNSHFNISWTWYKSEFDYYDWLKMPSGEYYI